MPSITNIVKTTLVASATLAAGSVVATRVIDARQERLHAEADVRPCDPVAPEVGQRPYPQKLPGHDMGFYERHVKRPQDFACALLACVGLAPVMGATALLVRVKLGSPVFFRQKRPGRDGRIFEIYKFRTMTDARDTQGNLLPDEARLTRFGRALRSTSLDELPELFNILRGDMAVIGPRPLLVQYLPLYSGRQARRHEVRPGLSGRAQVHGRNTESWEDKFEDDVAYVENISFAGDWRYIAQTVVKALKREGISSETSATMEEFMGTESAKAGADL